jgi:uncharacterized protein (TIGR02996 family)
MSEAGFLSAIRADPIDDATRLIYADYLEERDDPRGELLRLESRLAEPGVDYREFDALRERLKQLRAALYSKHKKWLATVDAPDRFTVLWTNEYCRRLQEFGKVGKPLGFAALSYQGQFKFQPGIHVYTIRIHQRKLYVIGRMRVADVATREVYLQANPSDGFLISPFERVVLVGERGMPIRPDTFVPHEMLQRFRYRAGDHEYPLKHVKYGELTHPIGLTGVTRITKQTAQDLDFLLTGKAARPLAAPCLGP